MEEHWWNSVDSGWCQQGALAALYSQLLLRAHVLRETLGNMELLIWKHRCVCCDQTPLFRLHWPKCFNFRVGGGRYGRGTIHWCIGMGSEADASWDRSCHQALQKELDLRVVTANTLRWKDAHYNKGPQQETQSEPNEEVVTDRKLIQKQLQKHWVMQLKKYFFKAKGTIVYKPQKIYLEQMNLNLKKCCENYR